MEVKEKPNIGYLHERLKKVMRLKKGSQIELV